MNHSVHVTLSLITCRVVRVGRPFDVELYALEEGMATHSSILAWRIPYTEEPGGLQSWGRKELDTAE